MLNWNFPSSYYPRAPRPVSFLENVIDLPLGPIRDQIHRLGTIFPKTKSFSKMFTVFFVFSRFGGPIFKEHFSSRLFEKSHLLHFPQQFFRNFWYYTAHMIFINCRNPHLCSKDVNGMFSNYRRKWLHFWSSKRRTWPDSLWDWMWKAWLVQRNPNGILLSFIDQCQPIFIDWMDFLQFRKLGWTKWMEKWRGFFLQMPCETINKCVSNH